MDSIRVQTASADYTVQIGAGLLPVLADDIRARAPSGVYVITDDNVLAAQGPALRAKLPGAEVVSVPPGESSKSLETLGVLYDRLLAAGIDRKGLIVAFGGGVVGDLAGLAAATILRGVAYVQVPTSLLAMLDSSVGGKTAINHSLGKNLIGAFYQPLAVCCDTGMLQTLPAREYASALAEAVKTALLAGPDALDALEQSGDALKAREPQAVTALVAACVRHKAAVVAADERELSGRRATLNLGHSLAHVIEALLPGRFLHGEAVAIGLAAALRISMAEGLEAGVAARAVALLHGFGLATDVPPELDREAALRALRHDKKQAGGSLNFVLLRAPGHAELSARAVDEVLMDRLIGAEHE
jgi:3-dehydroquinate synthase